VGVEPARPDPHGDGAPVVVPVRRYGQWVLVVVVVLLLAALVRALATNESFDYGAVSHYLFDPGILRGVRNTILLTLLAEVIGLVLGLGLALFRLSGNPILSTLSWIYIWFFRGVPVLVQLIFWFNLGLVFSEISIGIPFTDIHLFSSPTNQVITAFSAALLGLGLNEAAYLGELIRGGILAVPKGQYEAAESLGLTRGKTMRRIVLPQTLRVIVPGLSNQLIIMLKITALVSVITYGDLLSSAQHIYSTNLKTLELLVVASIWYVVLTSALTVGQYYLERHLARSSGQRLEPTPLTKLRARLRGAVSA
jgi:polar amino acid transport system permease protein